MAKRITTASAKQKGRRLQQWVCEQISRVTGIPWGQDMPIESRGMGQSGCDVRLEAEVKKIFPFSIECKNQERWNLTTWIKEAKANKSDDTDWLLVCGRNRAEPVVVMDAVRFFEIMKWKE